MDYLLLRDSKFAEEGFQPGTEVKIIYKNNNKKVKRIIRRKCKYFSSRCRRTRMRNP
jgi:hypothetical protein